MKEDIHCPLLFFEPTHLVTIHSKSSSLHSEQSLYLASCGFQAAHSKTLGVKLRKPHCITVRLTRRSFVCSSTIRYIIIKCKHNLKGAAWHHTKTVWGSDFVDYGISVRQALKLSLCRLNTSYKDLVSQYIYQKM